MHRVNNYLAAFLIAGLVCTASAAHAEPTDLAALAKDPQSFLGQDLEMKANCVKGGRAGDVLGYECTTKQGVYLNARDIGPEDAKEKLAGECAGGACEATLRFSPHSFTTSGVIEPAKSVVVFNAEKAIVSF